MTSLIRVLGLAALLATTRSVRADEVLLLVDAPPPNGLVVGHVDLTAAARWCRATPVVPAGLHAVDTADGAEVPIQFVPDIAFDAKGHAVGTVVVRLPRPGPARLRLRFETGTASKPGVTGTDTWDGRIVTASCILEHDPHKQGGLPWRITFPASGKVVDALRWNDRVHHRELGSFFLADDPEPRVERISPGPLCTVVRVQGRYLQGGKEPASRPTAVYDWFTFANEPSIYVVASIRQDEPFAWHESHILELTDTGGAFPRWAGGEPLAEGRFENTRKSLPQADWGLIHDGRNGIGLFHDGQVLLYDAAKASYIQAHGEAAWSVWDQPRREASAWLRIATDAQPVAAMQEAARAVPAGGILRVTVDALRARIDAAREQLIGAPADRHQQGWWRVQGARQLEAQGRFEEAARVIEGARLPGWTTLNAGNLGLILERTSDGIRLLNLFDSAQDRTLVPDRPLPLFDLTLKRAGADEPVTLTADRGWQEIEIVTDPARPMPEGLELRWRRPIDTRLGGLTVAARVQPDPHAGALRWRLTVADPPAPWSVWRVVFPLVAIADLGPRGSVFFPKAAGQVERDAWLRPVRFSGTYPSGWTSMQYLAAYDEAKPTGLYVAIHDPWGSTKDLKVESRPSERAVVFAVDQPAPDMGVPANRFELSGEAVWQLLRGDWFDAAMIYRDWVRTSAKWYPRLTPGEGRADTPRWMRELSVWALNHGEPDRCVPEVKAFIDFLGSPAAVHWYNWHQIPFDNDYPHYFPTRPGFADGVKALQASGTFVMPYINGRLWDTRDRGPEDFEFTSLARPAVSKREDGEPYVETYGSKESDGSPVRLGVMCPSTALWQARVREIVVRLMTECGVKGVYIDQIAAAAPTLCFDQSHGHPLGGGHWWTEGYWKLLEAIRRDMPADSMITTECNGEPYIRCFDGYLTWHWQYDGQVPAFPAVYGGAIQMFGRSYAGGATQGLALRMRAGQQLVFGEQIGWLAPGMVVGTENGGFFRDVVRLRRQLSRYFWAGEMARPPRLVGEVPKVRADWQWGGVDWVTTDAILTGAWHQPSAGRLVLVFVNVSDEAVTAPVAFDARPYGLTGPTVRLTRIGADGPGETIESPSQIERPATFPPRTAQAWEIAAP
jgi:hypothetical protein